MNKVLLIIQREYLTRVRKKSFLITTLLFPLLMIGFTAIMGIISASSSKLNNIAVVDESGYVNAQNLKNDKHNKFTFFDVQQLNDKIKSYADEDFDVLVHVGKLKADQGDSIKLYSESTLSLETKENLNDKLNSLYQDQLLLDAGMSRAKIDSIDNKELKIIAITKDKENDSSEIAAGIGYIMGLLIYIIMLIYGTMVMRGVMEEKTNRIAEVIVSSVKPFQLMMGKIVGIALVGLTQFVIWITFTAVLSSVLHFILPGADLHAGMNAVQELNQNPALQQKAGSQLTILLGKLASLNWFKIGFCFVFYFFGGYMLYASLFAAVGSLVNEDITEAQQYTFPITMPIIAGMFIMIQTIRDPSSGLAVFGSLFPLTSPIVMMARLGYDVPNYQLFLSMLFLVLGFLLTTWLSAKIYRVGILMYGKKPSWKEVLKWIRKN